MRVKIKPIYIMEVGMEKELGSLFPVVNQNRTRKLNFVADYR